MPKNIIAWMEGKQKKCFDFNMLLLYNVFPTFR